MEIKIIVSLFIGAFTMYAIMQSFNLYRGVVQKNAELEKRLALIEHAQKKRIPYQLQDDMLDVIALLDMSEHKRQMIEEIETTHKTHEERLLQEAKQRLMQTLATGTKREEK